MQEPRLYFEPGDRVRVREDVHDVDNYGRDQTILLATQGSLGVITSFDEYRIAYEDRLREPGGQVVPVHRDHLSGIRQAILDGQLYPVRFEIVAPPSFPVDVLCCKVGGVQLLHAFKFSLNNYEPILEKIE